ncbi:MAG: low molecular weight phosphatase family protein [Actinobacteria bacterium]|nr:low molecular weight phosphatase family protein [Actinomycetota bacterium]
MASILVVCTGNVCRSPMAEGMLRAALGRRLGDGAPQVASAGTMGWEDSATMPEAIEAAAQRGVDIAGHVARRLTRAMLDAADLELCMAHDHRETIQGERPEVFGRTFTLKELVRLLEGLGEPASGTSLVDRVREAAAIRASGFEGNPHDEDVADPLGMGLESYRAVGWELDLWIERLVEGLVGPVPARSTGRAGEEE